MEKLPNINLRGKELNGLPLFCQKIYYNKIVDIEDEEKCYFYSHIVDAVLVKEDEKERDFLKLAIMRERESRDFFFEWLISLKEQPVLETCSEEEEQQHPKPQEAGIELHGPS